MDEYAKGQIAKPNYLKFSFVHSSYLSLPLVPSYAKTSKKFFNKSFDFCIRKKKKTSEDSDCRWFTCIILYIVVTLELLRHLNWNIKIIGITSAFAKVGLGILFNFSKFIFYLFISFLFSFWFLGGLGDFYKSCWHHGSLIILNLVWLSFCILINFRFVWVAAWEKVCLNKISTQMRVKCPDLIWMFV